MTPPQTSFEQGLAHVRAGRLAEALAAFEAAIRLSPNMAAAHYNCAVLLQMTGQLERAIAAATEAAKLDPGELKHHHQLGLALSSCLRDAEAVRAFDEALRIDPRHAPTLSARGALLIRLGRRDEARTTLEAALAVDPTQAGTENNLATLHMDQGRFVEARAHFERAVSLAPGFGGAWSNLASLCKHEGKLQDAIACYQRAISASPNDADIHSNYLLSLHYAAGISATELLAAHRAWGDKHASVALRRPSQKRRLDSERPLRIGYVSGDFRTHSVASFLEPIFACHDQKNFLVFAYAEVRKPDETTERLKRLTYGWRSTLGVSDDAAAAQVEADEIDILIDLGGHTDGSRLGIAARKPAPIQLSYLGYPNTTGMRAIDYRLTDGFADPSGQTDPADDPRILIPSGFLCYQAPQDLPPVAPCPHLAKGYITFGSFNTAVKITQEQLALWARILQNVPGSRLLLKSMSFVSEGSREAYRSALVQLGISADRIEIVGWDPERRGHLTRYRDVDIALDTFPYDGTTTTCEALVMGVPVVTLAGTSHHSRVGVSLLSRVGCPELIADSPEAYVTIATQLASDSARMTSLRTGLRERALRGSLCDRAQFIGELEAILRELWRAHCEGRTYDPSRLEIERHADTREALGPVEAAIRSSALAAQGHMHEAFLFASSALARLHESTPQPAPDALLTEWQSRSLEEVLLKQSISFIGPSSFHVPHVTRPWLLRWAELNPKDPEPYLRFALVSALEAKRKGAAPDRVVFEALESAKQLGATPRAEAAMLCLRTNAPRVLVPYGPVELFAPANLENEGTFGLLEQGDWPLIEMEVFRALLGESGVFVDLNAGLGAFAISAALAWEQKGRVVIHEPRALEGSCVRDLAKALPALSWADNTSAALVAPQAITRLHAIVTAELLRTIPWEALPKESFLGALELTSTEIARQTEHRLTACGFQLLQFARQSGSLEPLLLAGIRNEDLHGRLFFVGAVPTAA